MKAKRARKRSANYEVHSHWFVTGPRSRGAYNAKGKWETGKFSHSHKGGDVPHRHPDTGPGSYTIDKDDWFRATGLRGGGRKKFTQQPSGEQMPLVELEEWQKSFEVHLGKPTPAEWGTGPGIGPAARMIFGSKMRLSKVKVEKP
jgi:hypothetical protein